MLSVEGTATHLHIRVIVHAQPQSPHPPDFANHSLNDVDAVCIQAWCHGKLAYYLESCTWHVSSAS